jgi:cell division septum initiation protein DivIVA
MKAIPELERDWAMRRLELFNELDGSVQQTIRTVLDVAAQITREAEEAAARLRHDAEVDSARMRKEADEERERVLADMRQRRDGLVSEVQDLEQQLEAVSSQLQSLATLRGRSSRVTSIRSDQPSQPPATCPAPSEPAAPTVIASETVATTLQPTPLSPGSVHTQMTVRNVSAFSKALEIQRSIQRIDGVRRVQALQFEAGALTLAVEHEAGLDLAGGLATMPLEVDLANQSDARLEITVGAV